VAAGVYYVQIDDDNDGGSLKFRPTEAPRYSKEIRKWRVEQYREI
jgi:hypothetical protein